MPTSNVGVVGRSILPTRNVGSGRKNGDESRWPSNVGGRQRGLALPQTFAAASNGRGSWRSAKPRSVRRPRSAVRLLREEQGVHQGYGRLRHCSESSAVGAAEARRRAELRHPQDKTVYLQYLPPKSLLLGWSVSMLVWMVLRRQRALRRGRRRLRQPQSRTS